MDNIVVVLVELAVVFQLVDAWTTYKLLQRPGFYEKNKLLERWMQRWGVYKTLFVVKGGYAGVIVGLYFVWKHFDLSLTWALLYLLPLLVITGSVTINNLFLYFLAGRKSSESR